MGWVRIDDHFDEHPKMAAVGPLGWALWMAGLAYCNRNLTDGHIPWSVARKLVSWEFLAPDDDGSGRRVMSIGIVSGASGEDVGSEYVIRLLLTTGLWIETDDGYRIHDYADYQPLREDVERKRAQTRERVERWRQRQDGVTDDVIKEAVTPLDAECNGVTNAARNAVGDAVSTPAPKPNPNPKKKTAPVANATGPNGRPSEHKPRGKSTPSGKSRVTYQTSSQPFMIFAALCDELGADISEVDPKEKDKQCGVAKQFLDRGHSEDDLRRLVRYLQSETWRTSPIDMTTCLDRVGPWKMNGQPATAIKSKNGTNMSKREEAMWKGGF